MVIFDFMNFMMNYRMSCLGQYGRVADTSTNVTIEFVQQEIIAEIFRDVLLVRLLKRSVRIIGV